MSRSQSREQGHVTLCVDHQQRHMHHMRIIFLRLMRSISSAQQFVLKLERDLQLHAA